MDDLSTIGNRSRFTCLDCGGALSELKDARPLRFLCHTGHAFSLRSPASAHELKTDKALWAALRALHELFAGGISIILAPNSNIPGQQQQESLVSRDTI